MVRKGTHLKWVLTPMEMQFSSPPEGNFTINLDPAFSSESLRGLKRQTTLMLSSAAISLSPDIFLPTLRALLSLHTLGALPRRGIGPVFVFVLVIFAFRPPARTRLELTTWGPGMKQLGGQYVRPNDFGPTDSGAPTGQYSVSWLPTQPSRPFSDI